MTSLHGLGSGQRVLPVARGDAAAEGDTRFDRQRGFSVVVGRRLDHATYCAAKAAVAKLTRSIACDYGRDGVRANTVCPGLTITEMTEAIMDDEALLAKAWERIPLRRAGTVDEVADAIFFLASDQAAFITGATLAVDGGQTVTDGGPEWGK